MNPSKVAAAALGAYVAIVIVAGGFIIAVGVYDRWRRQPDQVRRLPLPPEVELGDSDPEPGADITGLGGRVDLQGPPQQGSAADPQHTEGDGGSCASAGTGDNAQRNASDGPARHECGGGCGEAMPDTEGAGVGAHPSAALYNVCEVARFERELAELVAFQPDDWAPRGDRPD